MREKRKRDKERKKRKKEIEKRREKKKKREREIYSAVGSEHVSSTTLQKNPWLVVRHHLSLLGDIV